MYDGCTLRPVVAGKGFAAIERPETADSGFSRMSADWQSNLNDRSSAARSPRRLAAIDPLQPYIRLIWLHVSGRTLRQNLRPNREIVVHTRG